VDSNHRPFAPEANAQHLLPFVYNRFHSDYGAMVRCVRRQLYPILYPNFVTVGDWIAPAPPLALTGSRMLSPDQISELQPAAGASRYFAILRRLSECGPMSVTLDQQHAVPPIS